MYPTGRYEESVALCQRYATTFVDCVAEKYISLFSGQDPFFVEGQVVFGGGNQPEYFTA